MNLFELLRIGRRRLPESELLQSLLAARRQGEMRRFAKLCRDHVDVIKASVSRWQKPPDEVTGSPEALDEYIQTMGAVAQLLREFGHPELWDALVGDPDDNPITVWEKKLNEANLLANETRYDEAAELLMDHLIDTRHLRGSAVNRLQSLSQGSMGHVRFSAGKVDLAVGHYEQALQLCREQNDREGMRVYLSSLYESQRYLGIAGVAAEYARELGQEWDEAGDHALAKRYSRLSQIVGNGEPPLRVVAQCDARVVELDEVELQPSVELKLNFWRNRPGLPGATKRIDRGKALAEKGQSDDALESFREAAKIDPYEPDAHYQAGMVLCEQQLYLQAVEEYEICESLAPGWFFCRSDMWVARQLALGVMPHEVFLALRFLQDGPPNARKRMEIANRIQFHASTIPLFALLYGNVLQAAGRHREASQLWHRAIEANPEPDVRTRLLVSLSTLEENADKRQGLLEAAADLNGNLIAAAGAVLSLRFGRQARG